MFISDQALGVADGLDDEYTDLVEDWGDLADSGDPRDPYSGEIRQMSITIWNGGTTPFSDYFLEEDPEDVIVDVYQWFTGLVDVDKALVDVFVCQDPIAADEVSRLLSIDLVSLPMRYDAALGEILSETNWPNARKSDLGKSIDLVIGSPGQVPTLCAKTAATATMSGSVLSDTLTINAHEDLDVEDFLAAGTIQIGAERMAYASRTSSAFTISQRGADGTAAVEHLDREGIQQHITDFTYLISKGPVSAIANVEVKGIPAPASIYTAYPALNPARLVFTEKPYALDYAKGSTYLEMQFDAVNEALNTALQPHLAYDEAAKTSAAQVDEDNPLLALEQVTVNPDRGEIVKAYLGVEHWEEGAALQHDRVKVSIPGIGDLGYLSRPATYDDLTLEAEVDIDHAHGHSISGEHAHTFTDPAYAADESPHIHGGGGSQSIRKHASSQININLGGEVESVRVPNCPSPWQGATLHFEHGSFPPLSFRYSGHGSWIQGSMNTTVQIDPPDGDDVWIYFSRVQADWPSLTIQVWDIYIDFLVSGAIEPAYTGVGVKKVSTGAQYDGSDKDTSDVDDLTTDNVSLQVTDSGLPTRTVVNLFDITDNVSFDWGWFTGKEVRVEYEGTVDNKTVYLLHVFFDIEYRKVERIFSDEVTAEVTGLVDDGDGTYTGTPDAVITRPDHVRQYCLMACGGLAAGYINNASFAAAGVRYAAKSYEFDGVLPGNITVRDAEKKLSRQCRSRFFWDAGQAHIKFRESHADWSIDKSILQASSEIRIKGMSYQRKNVQDIVNSISLNYQRDWTESNTGIGGYEAIAEAQDNESIHEHGIREKPEAFFFDLVTGSSMAQDLADFYIEDGAPSQFYTIEAFMPYFDLQKEDHIRLTHDFMTLQKAAMRIAGIERVFGSGKLKRMNLLKIVAEAWYRLIQVAKQDTVTISDVLNIQMVMGEDIYNTVRVTDLIDFGFNFSETVSVADALAIIITWAVTETDTVSCTDTLAADMNVAIGDTVTVTEFLDWEIGAGFGMGAFGDARFGSMSEFDGNPEDFVNAVDVLVADMSMVLSDTVTCTDDLIFSSGFGSPWAPGEGFGDEPFGD